MNDEEFRRVLQKHREEPASPLQFEPCLELLMDNDYCQILSQSIFDTGASWERLRAVSSLATRIPDDPGVYMFVWSPEFTIRFAAPPEQAGFRWVLYVGRAGGLDGGTGTLRQRYANEYSKYVAQDPSRVWDSEAATTRTDRLKRYLTLRPLEYWYLPLKDPQEIQYLERRLIRLFGPPLNHQGKRLRLGKPTPAF